MRLDRLISLSLVNPFRPAAERRPHLPILMYHSVCDDPEPAFSPYYKICTAPRRFAEHMQWLHDAGWRGVTLSEGLAWLAAENEKSKPASLSPSLVSAPTGHVPEKLVAITFDDGFRDFHTAAAPALQQHGFTATMYLPTAFIGDERQSFKGRECMTWEEVRDLAAAGMEFGSHTVNHPVLYRLPWAEIECELRDSRAILEQQLGRPSRTFAYPYAFPQENRKYVADLTRLLRKHGYENCATTIIGRMTHGVDPYKLVRLPANSADDQALFLAKINGAYDWLRLPQAGVRTCNQWLKRNSRAAVDPRP